MLADDHAILLEAFRRLLEPECDVVATATDGRELVRIAREVRPDVLVTDISMPLENGLDAVKALRADLPDTRIVFLTVNEDPDLAARALRDGASAYVLKTCAARDLFDAILAAVEGRTYVTPSLAQKVDESLSRPAAPIGADKLSARQREILCLIAEGRSMKEIAKALSITPRTVAFHKYRMMEAIGVDSTAKLVQFAVKHGLARG
jgi:DNA-binding NarL/FixJ family response regulator